MEARAIGGFYVKLRTENILRHLSFSLWVQQKSPVSVKRYRKKIETIYKEARQLICPMVFVC